MLFLYRRLIIFGLGLVFAGIITALPVIANAQGIVKFSTAEDIAIAFYKTGNIQPDFENWVRRGETYRASAVTRKPRILQSERARLQNAYRNYNPDRDFLTLRSYVRLLPGQKTDAQGVQNHHMRIEFLNAPEALYFPYDFMEQRIALFPHKLDRAMTPDLTRAEYDLIRDGIRLSAKNTMIVRLRPRQADLTRPHKIDGLAQWVFTTDIVSLEIWDKRGNFLWEYNAPWYLTPQERKLQGLFQKPALQ